MKRHLDLICAVLKKDSLALWPLMALVVAIQTLQVLVGEFNFNFSALLRPIMPLVSALAAAVLTLLAFHQDAVTDGRHDGLTRPIPAKDLLTAKAILIFGAVFLPKIIGTFVAGAIDGRSLIESLLLAFTVESGWMVTFVVLMGAVAVITSTLLQAAVVMIGLFVLIPIMDRFVIKLSSTGEAVFFLGSGWVILKPIAVLALAAVIVVTWLQYGRRETARARTAFAVSVLAVLSLPALFTWERVLAAQQLTDKDPESAAALSVRLATECLPSIVINPQPASAAGGNNEGPIKISPAIFDQELRDLAGPNAVIFATPIVTMGAPEGWIAKLSYAGATFLSDGNEVIEQLHPAVYGPRFRQLGDQQVAVHFWLMSRGQHEAMATRAARLRIDYSFALLRPTSYDLEIDAERKFFPSLGYCGARKTSSRDVDVDCFKSGVQPSAVSVEWKGEPASREFVGDADYTPAWLSIPGGLRRTIKMKDAPSGRASSLVVTAYDVRSFSRQQLEVPGGLGNAIANCPIRPN